VIGLSITIGGILKHLDIPNKKSFYNFYFIYIILIQKKVIMSEQIKLTEEEMKRFTDLQAEFHRSILAMGQMQLRGYMIDEEIQKLKSDETKLKDEHLELQKQEEALINEIQTKYGEGSLNPKTGVFTPTK
jgi:hypothetical protein